MGAAARRELARRRSVKAGVAVIVGAVGLGVFAVSAQNGLPEYLPGVDRSTVRAQFDDVGALRVGDDVRIANVRSGFVQSIDLVDGSPVVTMKLDKGEVVHADATASITARSSLGQKYVDLTLGTDAAPALGDSSLTDDRTDEAVELDAVLGVFDARTRAATGSTLRELGQGVGGRGQDLNDGAAALPEVLGDLGTISSALSDEDGADLSTLLQTAASLSSALKSQSRQIESTTGQLADTFDALAAERGEALAETVRAAPETLTELRDTLQSLDGPLDSTRTAARLLRPGAIALGRATPAFRALLREAVPVLEAVSPVAGQAEGAIGDLTPVVGEAQRTVTLLATAMRHLSLVLNTLAPYSVEILDFFASAASALGQGDGAGRWLRIYPVLASENVSGNLPLRDPLLKRQAYPAPFEAQTHRTNPTLGGLQ